MNQNTGSTQIIFPHTCTYVGIWVSRKNSRAQPTTCANFICSLWLIKSSVKPLYYLSNSLGFFCRLLHSVVPPVNPLIAEPQPGTTPLFPYLSLHKTEQHLCKNTLETRLFRGTISTTAQCPEIPFFPAAQKPRALNSYEEQRLVRRKET